MNNFKLIKGRTQLMLINQSIESLKAQMASASVPNQIPRTIELPTSKKKQVAAPSKKAA